MFSYAFEYTLSSSSPSLSAARLGGGEIHILQVMWRKPRLLGREELRPFLTRDEAAFKIQQLHRNWKAREIARDAMRAEWSRVYSPQVVPLRTPVGIGCATVHYMSNVVCRNDFLLFSSIVNGGRGGRGVQCVCPVKMVE